jgi:N-acetylneuraminic acid mutarotase
VANSFAALTATLTTPRGGHTATLLPNGRVLIAGGFNNSSIALNTAELFDPVTQTFTPLIATMTSHRANHTATLLPSGQVLLTGGNSAGVTFNTAEVYDPVGNSFTALAPTMTTVRSVHTATLLPIGRVLLAGGGILQASGAFTVFNTAELYDPVANSFTPLATTMTTPRIGHAASLLPNGQVLLTGGGNGTSMSSFTVFGTAEVYSP